MEVLLFIIGACLGSFFLVVGKRLPINEDVLFSRSRCDKCKKELKWYDLIPIFSYVFLKGKCRYCGEKISPLNLIVEIFMGLFFALGYHFIPIGYNFYAYLVLSSLMMLIFISDFSYYIILDSPLIISSILLFILKFIFFGYKDALISIVSGILLFLVMYLIKIIGDKEMSVKAMMESIGLKGRDNFLNQYLTPALSQGYVRMLYPKSPRHPRQKYLLTPKGIGLLDYLNSICKK